MASQIEAIEIKRKMFFEHDGAPYHCLDVEVSKPTARGGQTLVRLKMRNLLTRAVFDKTFKAGEKFREPDLVRVEAIYQYSDGDGFHFMDQESYETDATVLPGELADHAEQMKEGVTQQPHDLDGHPGDNEPPQRGPQSLSGVHHQHETQQRRDESQQAQVFHHEGSRGDIVKLLPGHN